jgi:hypothetical protein
MMRSPRWPHLWGIAVLAIMVIWPAWALEGSLP